MFFIFIFWFYQGFSFLPKISQVWTLLINWYFAVRNSAGWISSQFQFVLLTIPFYQLLCINTISSFFRPLRRNSFWKIHRRTFISPKPCGSIPFWKICRRNFISPKSWGSISFWKSCRRNFISQKSYEKYFNLSNYESSKTVLFCFVVLSLLTNVQNKTSLSVGALRHSLSLTHSINSFIHSFSLFTILLLEYRYCVLFLLNWLL